jgi:ribosomal protein S18 acetylase RimI-like enzyme
MILNIADINNYEIKPLTEIYLDEILRLQDIVVKNLLDPANYYVEPIEFFSNLLIVEKQALGLFYKNQLVGFHMASYQHLAEKHLGVDIGLKEEERLQCIQMGPVAIHPDHRMKGLLTRIAREHIKVLEEMGYRHICLTISPNNFPTIRTTMAHGFVIKNLKLKYNNVLRYILHLDLTKPVNSPQYSVRIPNTDIESQKFMLNLGFYGYDVVKNDSGFDLVFGYDEIKA